MGRLRIVFFGTPAFAVPTLSALLASPHHVVGVVTQPDRPRGRGQRVSDAPVKALAVERGLPVLQPERLDGVRRLLDGRRAAHDERRLPVGVARGDQLDARSAAFDGFDPQQDAVWMAEVDGESTKVWSSKPRIALFLAAMRHFCEALRGRGWAVHYQELGAHPSLASALTACPSCGRPRRWSGRTS